MNTFGKLKKNEAWFYLCSYEGYFLVFSRRFQEVPHAQK